MLLDNVKCVPQVGFFGIQILNNNKQQQHHSVFYWSDALPVAQTTPSKYWMQYSDLKINWILARASPDRNGESYNALPDLLVVIKRSLKNPWKGPWKSLNLKVTEERVGR